MSLVVEEADGVAVWRLDRPEVLNALDGHLLEALRTAVAATRRSATVRCVVLTGAGRAFSAGADLKAMRAFLESGSRADLRAFLARFQALSAEVRELDQPLVAAINGHALAGGFELACLCDVRLAADTATFALPDVPLGISPTSGMTWLLPRIVGLGWAKHLTYTGETIDARQAERIGFVTRVVPAGELMAVAMAMARTIAGHPPLGVAHSKRGFDRAAESDLSSALAAELEAELACFDQPEVRARLRAFTERRRSRP